MTTMFQNSLCCTLLKVQVGHNIKYYTYLRLKNFATVQIILMGRGEGWGVMVIGKLSILSP